MLNRQAHVGWPQGRPNRAIHELGHRVHQALPMQNHVDLLVWQAKQPVRFDDFESLVHQGCRIDRHFWPHHPVRVRQRLFA